ncbi:hypothetical protein [Methanocella sp. MCL-LM]|uniref:hypothetical protein n=1 Tax=Methanocella sp. MCL-LM TaxID=3412035 RepID=UPI003C75B808
MKTGYLAAIVGLMILSALVSGCAEQGVMSNSTNDNTSNNSTVTISIDVTAVPGIPLPEAFEAEEAPWFEYDVAEQYLSSGQNYVENLRVRVGSENKTIDGLQFMHKLIKITPRYGDTHSYDILVDSSSGKILSGNYTSVNMGVPHTSLVPPGADYASTLGYLDVPARLSSGKAGAPVFVGCETILFEGEPYQCTLYNRTYDNTVYTIWINASLPGPARIVAHPASPEETVLRAYVLAGWKDTTSAGTGIPSIKEKPGPSKLFNIANLTWYSYLFGEGGPGSMAMRIEHRDATYEGIPARYTNISSLQLNGDYGESMELYERKADGRILFGNKTTYNFGRPVVNTLIGPGVYPGNYYEDMAGYYDVLALFNAEDEKGLEHAGTETVEYAGHQYVCDRYHTQTEKAEYAIWYNASMPLPLKVTVKYNRTSFAGTYRLTGWDKEQRSGILTPTPSPAMVISPTSKPGPSMLFDMDNVSWHQYAVTVPMNDTVRHQKLKVEYGFNSFGAEFRNGTMLEVRENMIAIEQIRVGEDTVSQAVIYEDGSGAFAGGSVWGGRTDMPGTFRSLGLDSEHAAWEKKRDISTRFDSDTDRKMQFAGYENIRYKGDLYNCTGYDVKVDNDNFRVWWNASLPLPPKIIVSYEQPDFYFGRPPAKITGPIIYELMEWG